MENRDDWLAPDKFQHVIFCFSIAIIFCLLASRSRYPFLRQRSIFIGSLISLGAGAAKEIADEIGFFSSAGASFKDAAADLVGIFLAVVLLSISKAFSTQFKPAQPTRGSEMV